MSAIEILANNKTIVMQPYSYRQTHPSSTTIIFTLTGANEYLEITRIACPVAAFGSMQLISLADIGGTSSLGTFSAPYDLNSFNLPKRLIVPPNYQIILGVQAGTTTTIVGTKYVNSP